MFVSIYVEYINGLWVVSTDSWEDTDSAVFETEEGANAYALYLESEYDKRDIDSGIFTTSN